MKKNFSALGIVLVLVVMVVATISGIMVGLKTENVWRGILSGVCYMASVGVVFVGMLCYKKGSNERGVSRLLYLVSATGLSVLGFSVMARTLLILLNLPYVSESMTIPTDWGLVIGGILTVAPMVYAGLCRFIEILPNLLKFLMAVVKKHKILACLILGSSVIVSVVFGVAAGIVFFILFVLECLFFRALRRSENRFKSMYLAVCITLMAAPMAGILIDMFSLQRVCGFVPVILIWIALGILLLLVIKVLFYGLYCLWQKLVK